MENLQPLDHLPAVIRILTDLERDRLSQELWHLIRAQKIRASCREHDDRKQSRCCCAEGGCRFRHHLEAARKLWEKRSPGVAASASREGEPGSA